MTRGPDGRVRALFCGRHDTSEKRTKVKEVTYKPCRGCRVRLRTNYPGLIYCPTCSLVQSKCLICGDHVGPAVRGEMSSSAPVGEE